MGSYTGFDTMDYKDVIKAEKMCHTEIVCFLSENGWAACGTNIALPTDVRRMKKNKAATEIIKKVDKEGRVFLINQCGLEDYRITNCLAMIVCDQRTTKKEIEEELRPVDTSILIKKD